MRVARLRRLLFHWRQNIGNDSQQWREMEKHLDEGKLSEIHTTRNSKLIKLSTVEKARRRREPEHEPLQDDR
jgi:diketogulonate reductase-like aldo/keto reductase